MSRDEWKLYSPFRAKASSSKILSTIRGPDVGLLPPDCIDTPGRGSRLAYELEVGEVGMGYEEKETCRLGPATLFSVVKWL
jgi:hypothetical protein